LTSNLWPILSANTSECGGQDMFHTDDQVRQTRIATLLRELAALRQDRLRNDLAGRRRIESELVVLLEAEIHSRRMARRAETASAETSG
jgi:hypothetical protein